ncbi:SDR family oxidoreductase (plasmid) [Halobaculum sp. CBA1158]|uniref:SDR family NAD(P)-dependent oxidoreductase n=1 Tax=Halobaculum sp. CBA1158 TaxID=2904243 RepID=UPI001F18A75C|nr:SDR family NAD(P)-dependent oxidoreductase [Halobaculum sp. CBA1158]UIP01491.1 SDR family oxidoreductase [Halobaculum sp. CBA1158]
MSQPTLTEQIGLDDEVVCVTGGAGGIGTAIGETVAELGADVALADVDLAGARENAEALEEKYGVNALAVETDVSSYPEAEAMVETVADELGPIDVLVNNAGIASNQRFADTDPGDWETWIGVALFGTLNCTHAVIPSMVARGRGTIVNFASGSYRGNDPGLAVYGAAKAANVSFTKTIAKEVGPDGVRVNCVSPGTVRTPATEDWLDAHEDTIAKSYALERVGEPEDVANVVALLAGEATGWVTGEVVHVDGGYLRR